MCRCQLSSGMDNKLAGSMGALIAAGLALHHNHHWGAALAWWLCGCAGCHVDAGRRVRIVPQPLRQCNAMAAHTWPLAWPAGSIRHTDITVLYMQLGERHTAALSWVGGLRRVCACCHSAVRGRWGGVGGGVGQSSHCSRSATTTVITSLLNSLYSLCPAIPSCRPSTPLPLICKCTPCPTLHFCAIPFHTTS